MQIKNRLNLEEKMIDNNDQKTGFGQNLFFMLIFTVSMAYLESAVVVYLRHLLGITNHLNALNSFDPFIRNIEMGRELATVIMLATAGWMAGRNRQSRFGFFLASFGLWDIFYYLWLHILIGWPSGLLDNDLLFMIPLPWWGPVLAPALLSLLMIISGVGMVVLEGQGHRVRLAVQDWLSLGCGVLVILYVFMADALGAIPSSQEILEAVHPTSFQWWVFLIGYCLIAFALRCTVFSNRSAIRPIKDETT